LILDRIESG